MSTELVDLNMIGEIVPRQPRTVPDGQPFESRIVFICNRWRLGRGDEFLANEVRALVKLLIFLGHLQRRVRRVEGEVDEEWAVLVFGDEVDGGIGEHIGAVAFLLDLFGRPAFDLFRLPWKTERLSHILGARDVQRRVPKRIPFIFFVNFRCDLLDAVFLQTLSCLPVDAADAGDETKFRRHIAGESPP